MPAQRCARTRIDAIDLWDRHVPNPSDRSSFRPAISCPTAITAADHSVAGVSPAQLSDTFSQARAGGARSHDAIDIMAPRGTPVIAVAAGRVEKLLFSPAGGNTAYVRSPDGRTIYYYAHLDEYAPGLAEGQSLQQGSAIGTVGFSGNADPAAPHLHFAVLATAPERKWWDAATAINPYPLLKRH